MAFHILETKYPSSNQSLPIFFILSNITMKLNWLLNRFIELLSNFWVASLRDTRRDRVQRREIILQRIGR